MGANTWNQLRNPKPSRNTIFTLPLTLCSTFHALWFVKFFIIHAIKHSATDPFSWEIHAKLLKYCLLCSTKLYSCTKLWNKWENCFQLRNCELYLQGKLYYKTFLLPPSFYGCLLLNKQSLNPQTFGSAYALFFSLLFRLVMFQPFLLFSVLYVKYWKIVILIEIWNRFSSLNV